MKWLSIDLAKLSGGNGWRAAGILVVAHLIPGPVVLGLWFLGLLPIFDDLRWIPVSIGVTFSVLCALWMFLAFGFWGTVRTYGRGHGESYTQTFSPGVGFALGWLRWFMQIVMVGLMLIPVGMLWVNVRWWHLTGTEELDALPDRAATIPVMQEWERTDLEASETGLVAWMDSTMEGPEPEGFVEQRFTVPDSFDFQDLKAWLESPEWAEPADGAAFGAIRIEECSPDSTHPSCRAHLVPPTGEHPEYFVRATFYEPASRHGEPTLKVRLNYQQYVPPEYDVSQETVDRAEQIPVPQDWLRIDAKGAETSSGETFSQYYSVPESFDRKALEAWVNGSQWTEPTSGEPFGAIEVDSCREVGQTEPTSYLCSAMVAGTERVPTEPSTGPVESLAISLDANHTVRVKLERNG